MKTKTVIITGANSGIGKSACIRFAHEGHHVVMACRDLKRSEAVRAEIISDSGNNNIDLMQIDMSSFESIKKFCELFKSRFNKLDVLINNAAYFEHGNNVYQLNPDGYELIFATNTLGPYLLCHDLKELLAASDDARIIMANSENIMHYFDPKRKIEFDNLRGEFKDSREFKAYKFYGDSKIALLMVSSKMAEEYKSLGIKVNSVIIPGVKLSKETMQKLTPVYRLLAKIKQPFSLEQSVLGDCYFKLSTSDEFKEFTGVAFNAECKILPPAQHDKGIGKLKELLSFRYIPKYAYNEEATGKIWQIVKQVESL